MSRLFPWLLDLVGNPSTTFLAPDFCGEVPVFKDLCRDALSRPNSWRSDLWVSWCLIVESPLFITLVSLWAKMLKVLIWGRLWRPSLGTPGYPWCKWFVWLLFCISKRLVLREAGFANTTSGSLGRYGYLFNWWPLYIFVWLSSQVTTYGGAIVCSWLYTNSAKICLRSRNHFASWHRRWPIWGLAL